MTNPKKVPPAIQRRVLVVVGCPVDPYATLMLDDRRATTAAFLRAAPDGGQVVFSVPSDWPVGWQVHLDISATGYQSYRTTFVLRDFDVYNPATDEKGLVATQHVPQQDERVDLVPIATTPVRTPITWRVDGKFFVDQAGNRAVVNGASSFALIERELHGVPVDDVLDELVDLGFNLVRFFTTCDLMFQLRPGMAGYDAAADRVLQKLYARGLSFEASVLVDAANIFPTRESRVTHWNWWAQRCAGLPGMLELVNEGDQTVNAFGNPTDYQQAVGIVCSRGSNGAGAPPVGCSFVTDAAGEIVASRVDLAPWGYVPQHNRRNADWPREVGHNTMEWADTCGVPGVTNETTRPDQGRGPIPSDWFDAAGNAAVLCAGATFHHESGKYSRMMTATERACAAAWIEGMRAVPLYAQRGAYVAGHNGNFPIDWEPADSSRAHGRVEGNRGVLSLPQPRPGFVAVGRDGWRVTNQTGSIVTVER